MQIQRVLCWYQTGFAVTCGFLVLSHELEKDRDSGIDIPPIYKSILSREKLHHQSSDSSDVSSISHSGVITAIELKAHGNFQYSNYYYFYCTVYPMIL